MIEADLNGLVMSIFINNIKIMALKESGITQHMKIKLIAIFSIVDIGSISFYLDLKVE